MALSKPWHAREPDCVHSNHTQPASACVECQHGPELHRWQEEWAAWLAENPDSPEARWVAEMDKRHSVPVSADPEEVEDAEFVSASDLDDDMFPEWDAAAELADDARRGK